MGNKKYSAKELYKKYYNRYSSVSVWRQYPFLEALYGYELSKIGLN